MLDAPDAVASQYRDNLHWIKNAEKNQMVVGSEARILYADANVVRILQVSSCVFSL